MNSRHLSRFETGALKAPLRTLKRIAEVFEVPVEDFTESPPLKVQRLIPDAELLEQFQALSQLDEEDRKAVKRILAALIMKHHMQEMVHKSA
jgi:hypothetical protein